MKIPKKKQLKEEYDKWCIEEQKLKGNFMETKDDIIKWVRECSNPQLIKITIKARDKQFEKGINLIQKKANQLRSSADIRDMNIIINLVKQKLKRLK